MLLPVCRSSMFYNFVKAMLVRNPKKRPSASKMLSVRTAHTLLLSVKMRNDDKCIRTLFLLLLSPSGQKISYCRIKTTLSLLVL